MGLTSRKRGCHTQAYLEALKRIGRLADAKLDRADAERVLSFIAAELDRIGYVITESVDPSETIH